ncbi:hypothetical protein GGR56DRAFT_636843 [Xylariaceae sp. FL0804]|nr:hypothetical protein GGR56DRAFT_636843 [Xylariaceae sp. FL0804]
MGKPTKSFTRRELRATGARCGTASPPLALRHLRPAGHDVKGRPSVDGDTECTCLSCSPPSQTSAASSSPASPLGLLFHHTISEFAHRGLSSPRERRRRDDLTAVKLALRRVRTGVSLFFSLPSGSAYRCGVSVLTHQQHDPCCAGVAAWLAYVLLCTRGTAVWLLGGRDSGEAASSKRRRLLSIRRPDGGAGVVNEDMTRWKTSSGA